MAKYGKRENYNAALELIENGVWRVDPKQGYILGKGRSQNNWKPIGVIRDGYLRVRIGLKGPSVSSHRVIWEFVNGPSDLDLTINHKNGNTLDNSIDNLELISNAENSLHGHRVLGRANQSRNKGEGNPMSRFTKDDILDIRARLARGDKGVVVAKVYDTVPSTISAIKHRRVWKDI